jgi:hypothetical protein
VTFPQPPAAPGFQQPGAAPAQPWGPPAAAPQPTVYAPPAPPAAPQVPAQYQTTQYQPPAAPATVPAENLPGWGQIMGGGGKSLATKDAAGNWVTGTWQGGVVLSVDPPRQRTAPREQGGAPQFFKDGQPMVSYPVTLLTQDRDPADPQDKGVRKDYIQSTAIKAVKTELTKHGVAEPQVGAQLYRMLVTPGGPGGAPGQKSHIWQYHYAPPTAETLALVAAHNAAPVAAAATPAPTVAAPDPVAAQYPPAAPVPVAAPTVAPAAYAQPVPMVAPPGVDPAQWAAFMATQPNGGSAVPPTNGAPVPPAAPAPGQPSAWPYGQPAATPQAPAPAPSGVPAPPAFPGM